MRDDHEHVLVGIEELHSVARHAGVLVIEIHGLVEKVVERFSGRFGLVEVCGYGGARADYGWSSTMGGWAGSQAVRELHGGFVEGDSVWEWRIMRRSELGAVVGAVAAEEDVARWGGGDAGEGAEVAGSVAG